MMPNQSITCITTKSDGKKISRLKQMDMLQRTLALWPLAILRSLDDLITNLVSIDAWLERTY
jgi:hypothetical protein